LYEPGTTTVSAGNETGHILLLASLLSTIIAQELAYEIMVLNSIQSFLGLFKMMYRPGVSAFLIITLP
jgi:hypothetical protein